MDNKQPIARWQDTENGAQLVDPVYGTWKAEVRAHENGYILLLGGVEQIGEKYVSIPDAKLHAERLLYGPAQPATVNSLRDQIEKLLEQRARLNDIWQAYQGESNRQLEAQYLRYSRDGRTPTPNFPENWQTYLQAHAEFTKLRLALADEILEEADQGHAAHETWAKMGLK